MPDLYKLLGVSNRARLETIRAAYRKKSKAAHPDSPTGSEEAFLALKRAHDILTDQVARAHYDQTGEVVERKIDQGRAEILALVASALDIAVHSALENGADVWRVDLVKIVGDAARANLKAIAKRAEEVSRVARTFEKLVGRFAAKMAGDENLLQQIVTAKLLSFELEAKRLEAAKANWEAALVLIEQHSFRHEVAVVRTILWHNLSSTATTI